MANADTVKRWAEITAQAYIDEFPDHADIDPQWLRQTWELDAAQQRWYTSTWEPYRSAARQYFLKEKTALSAARFDSLARGDS